MNVLFVMDPFEKIHPQRDTTYLMIREANRRGLATYFCEHTDLYAHGEEVRALACRIERLEASAAPDDDERCDYALGAKASRTLGDFGLVFLRTDPPFDLRYVTATYLLELAVPETLIVNHPVAVREWNEKLSILKFPGVHPETLVASDYGAITDFIERAGGKAVVKDLFRSGGDGVFIADRSDAKCRSLIEAATGNGHNWVMVQRFVAEGKKGDKRVVLFDGEPVGAVLRVSQTADFRNNLHLGGAAVKTELTAREREICGRLGPALRERGLFFAGIDFLGDLLTEINITSPTGFQEINRLERLTESRTLEAQMFERLLKKLPRAAR